MPTRGIKDVIIGLDNLFGDLMDFDDPLNSAASDMYSNNRVPVSQNTWIYYLIQDAFTKRVAEYIAKHCRWGA